MGIDVPIRYEGRPMRNKPEVINRALAKNTTRMCLRLTRSTQGDVIAKLDSLGNQRTAYIVRLIREDIAREKAGSEKGDCE